MTWNLGQRAHGSHWIMAGLVALSLTGACEPGLGSGKGEGDSTGSGMGPTGFTGPLPVAAAEQCEGLGVSLLAQTLRGPAPLDVAFDVQVTGGGDEPAVAWDFGDGPTSSATLTVAKSVTADVDLSQSRGIACDGSGGYWVLREPYSTDSDPDVLYHIGADGERLSEDAWKAGRGYKSLAYDGDSFYASYWKSGVFCPCGIDKVSQSGKVLDTFTDAYSDFSPASLTWGDDTLWVEANGEKLVRMSDDGSVEGSVTADSSVYIWTMAYGDGKLLAVDFGDEVYALDPATGAIVETHVLPGGGMVDAMTVCDGDLVVLSGETIERLPLGGAGTAASHTYAKIGSYEATVSVTGDDGTVCSASATIEVVCGEGERKCDGKTAMECKGGAFQVSESCPDACVDGVCTDCAPHADKQCKGGDSWWYDSCGNAEELAKSCSAGCSSGSCKSCNTHCSCSCSCGTSTINALQGCLDSCTSECSDACSDMCGSYW